MKLLRMIVCPTQRQMSAVFLASLMTVGTFATTGCTVSAAQIESDINLVLTQTSQVLSAIGDAPLAAEISQAETELQKAEAAWKGGSPVADVISALNILEIAVAAVPVTAPYSPEVDVIVAGIEFVLTNLSGSGAAPAAAAATRARALPAANPHKGAVRIKMTMMHPTPSGAEKALWNKAVAAHPVDGLRPL